MFMFVVGIFASPFGTGAYFLQRWLYPCDAATLGYFLFPECSNVATHTKWGFQSSFGLFIICIFVSWQFTDAIGIFGFHVITIMFVQAFFFSAYLRWIQIYLLNTLTDPMKRCRALRMYRELQILNRYYNKLQQNVFVFVAMFLITVAVITGLYILIAFGSKIKLHEVLLFSCLSFDGLVVILVGFSAMGNVNEGAVKAIHHVKMMIPFVSGTRDRKWVGKYWRSLLPLKVYIGEVNFVDKMTPFTLLSFCLDKIVNLLLVD